MGGKRITEEQKNYIKALTLQGFGQCDIAVGLGLSASAVRQQQSLLGLIQNHQRSPISEVLKDEIKTLTLQGVSCWQIADTLGLSRDTVSRYRVSMGLVKERSPKGEVTSRKLERIRSLTLQGEPQNEIAEALELHPKTVSKCQAKLGIRPKRERSFRFKSPDGELFEVPNLEKGWATLEVFAQSFNLHAANFSALWRGKYKQYRGWEKA